MALQFNSLPKPKPLVSLTADDLPLGSLLKPPSLKTVSLKHLAIGFSLAGLILSGLFITSFGDSATIPLKLLGDEPGYVLKTVRTHRDLFFTRPTNVSVSGASAVKLKLQHSAALLPKRSFLSVLLNNRIIETIRLTGDNVKTTAYSIPLNPKWLKPENKITFLVDQHYTDNCEDPFSAELWTTVLPETAVELVYNPKPLNPELANFPFPFMDRFGLKPPKVDFYLGKSQTALSQESLEAVGVLSTRLGQYFQWRPLTVGLFNSSESSNHLMVVGTAIENPQVLSLVAKQQPKLVAGGQWVNPQTGKALVKDEGVVVLLPHPKAPEKGMLVVSGNTPAGVAKAAHFLTQEPNRQLMSGPYAIVNDYVTGNQPTFRQWQGFIQQPDQISLEQLGFESQTSRGFASTPVFYNVKLMPDIFLKGKRAVKLKTVFSYSSQLDASQSKLEIRWNGRTLDSVPLQKLEGENLAFVEVEIPTEEVFTYNDLEYKFQLYPEKLDLCKFVTDAHIWGTVHNNTTLDVDGEFKTPLPDLGLLNDGGFPLTVQSDLSQLAFVLPDSPHQAALNAFLQITNRLGRLTNAGGDVNFSVYKASTLSDEVRNHSNLVVIGGLANNKLFPAFNDSKLKLLTQPTKERELSHVDYSPNLGLMEMIQSPWNKNRVAVFVTGESPQALNNNARLFASSQWFSKLGVGNLAVVDSNGPRSLTLMKKGDARFVRPEDYGQTAQWPTWVWWTLGLFALIGGISLIGWIFKLFRR